MHIYKNGELIEESRFATICKHFPASIDFGECKWVGELEPLTTKRRLIMQVVDNDGL